MKKGKNKQQQASERRLNIWTPYVTRLRSCLCLDEWTITIHEMQTEKDGSTIPGADSAGVVLADMTPMETRHKATMRLYPAFFAESAHTQRHIVTHELMHVRFADMQYAARAFEHAIDELSWRHLYRHFSIELERLIDDVTAQIAPSLPLPPTEESEEA